jgi:hypothetical protein
MTLHLFFTILYLLMLPLEILSDCIESQNKTPSSRVFCSLLYLTLKGLAQFEHLTWRWQINWTIGNTCRPLHKLQLQIYILVTWHSSNHSQFNSTWLELVLRMLCKSVRGMYHLVLAISRYGLFTLNPGFPPSLPQKGSTCWRPLYRKQRTFFCNKSSSLLQLITGFVRAGAETILPT